jgi:hypothetical protein
LGTFIDLSCAALSRGCQELELSHGSVWHMLNEMGYRKIASKYVSHALTCYQMQASVDICQRNLRRYEYDLTLLHRNVVEVI